MKPIILPCLLLLTLQQCVSPSHASQIPKMDVVVNRMRASADNSFTFPVMSEELHFCSTSQFCKQKAFQVCEFGGGSCQVGYESKWENNKPQYYCTVRISDCEEKPEHAEKSYEQVIEDLQKTGVSNFFQLNPDDCLKKYCTDQIFNDMRANGRCSEQFLYPNTCQVRWQQSAKFPDIAEGLSREEIYQRSLQVGGVDIKTTSQEECRQSCRLYQSMCSGSARFQCSTQTSKYTPTNIFCNIYIQCTPVPHHFRRKASRRKSGKRHQKMN